uniref:Coiled-coil domain-containing protein 125 n=1 Tax=Pavo cristatus TaxID=9049 RepID=A0A8C9FES7_PAVCR
MSKIIQPFPNFCRIYCENTALKEALKLRTEEVKTLKSENASKTPAALPLNVLLFWNNSGVNYEQKFLSGRVSCYCGSVCYSSRQVRSEEMDLTSKDEAFIMADAFRIAFEQQLMQKKDQALRLAEVIKIKKETKFINWRRLKEDGSVKVQGNKNSLGQKLSGLLSTDADSRKVEELDNPHEILKMLIDLVNDKEEALAHQRKVSYMLARAMELKEAAQETQGQPSTGHGGKVVQPSGPAALGPAESCFLPDLRRVCELGLTRGCSPGYLGAYLRSSSR